MVQRFKDGLVPSAYPPPFRVAFLRPRYWPTWLGLGVLRLLTLLPARVRHALSRIPGALMYRLHEKRRRIVELNLAWCFPERDAAQRARMARAYFRLMAQSLFDYGVLWWGRPARLDRMVALEGEEHLRRCAESGRPVILLTCHNAALDFGAAALTRRFRSVGLVKEARNPLVDWYVARGRTRFQGILYRRREGLRPVIRAVRAGHAFYYLPDEDLGPEHSVFVPFFGVPTATITALSRLARLCDAEVLPYMTRYEPQRGCYVAQVFAPLADFPGTDERVDTARMNLELERMIRMAPEQYMWSLRIFQTRPDGAPSPYRRPNPVTPAQ